jgi:hypothetical protein
MALWFLFGGNSTSVADDESKDDFIKNNKIIRTGDSLLHVRQWRDYKVQQMSGKYYTYYPEYDKSVKYRNAYEGNDFSDIYQTLVDKDEKTIEVYAKLFDSLNTANNNNWQKQLSPPSKRYLMCWYMINHANKPFEKVVVHF